MGSDGGLAATIGAGLLAAAIAGAGRGAAAWAWTLPRAASKKARCAARASAADRVGWVCGWMA